MAAPVDPAAEKVKRRKAKKRNRLREAIRTDGIASAVRLFLSGAQARLETPPEDCQRCKDLNRAVA